MDLSQPVSVVIAFAAGFGFMLCTRLVFSLLSYSLYAVLIFGALFMLGQNGVVQLDDLKDSTAAQYAKGAIGQLAAVASGAKDWVADHEIKVHIAQRQSAAAENSFKE